MIPEPACGDHRMDTSGFTGSQNWYRHPMIRSITYTDGARYVAETAQAYWLLDEIALAQQFNAGVKTEEFQVWTLRVTGTTAVLSCQDGNENTVFSKQIGYTDFPEPDVTLWYANDVIYLPSEH